MHGNPLVILSAYMPHDASDETNRLAAWEEMTNRVAEITHNKNVIILGDFNAAIHARKPGEDEYIGPHVWGKGMIPQGKRGPPSGKHEQKSSHRPT